MSQGLAVLRQLFNGLSSKDKAAFLRSLVEPEKVKPTLEPKHITCCPYCKSQHFIKNGKRNHQQRYLCRDCRRSFMGQTNTIFSGSKKELTVWKLYVDCMVENIPYENVQEFAISILPQHFVGDISF